MLALLHFVNDMYVTKQGTKPEIFTFARFGKNIPKLICHKLYEHPVLYLMVLF